MALKQEMTGLELKRITEDSHHMNTTLKPLASLNENICDELHTELHSFNIAESRSSPYSNKRHIDDSLVKANIMWRPVGHNVNEEPDELRSFGTTGAYQQRRKSSTVTNLYKKATYGEKENVETGPGWPRGSLEFSNRCAINPGLSGSVDGKRLQEGPAVYSKPVTRPETKAADEPTKAVGGPGLSLGDCKPVNRYKTSPSTANSGARCAYSPNRKPDFSSEDSMCFASDSSVQSSAIESRKGARATALVQKDMKEASQNLCLESISTKSPLLSPYQDGGDWRSSIFTQNPEAADPFWLSQLESGLKSKQNSEKNVHDVSRLCRTIAETPCGQSNTQIMKECSMPVFAESDIQSLQDTQTCDNISIQSNDHFVVLFSEQKALKGSAGRKIRQELIKLSSFCSQYSHKFQSWATCLATSENLRGCLRCLQQFFWSPPTGFVNLKSHKIPEFSTKATLRSSSRKLAKDKELKAVLTKINEVLVSMERISPHSMQESNPNFKSQEGFEASGSCSQHESAGPWQQ